MRYNENEWCFIYYLLIKQFFICSKMCICVCVCFLKIDCVCLLWFVACGFFGRMGDGCFFFFFFFFWGGGIVVLYFIYLFYLQYLILVLLCLYLFLYFKVGDSYSYVN